MYSKSGMGSEARVYVMIPERYEVIGNRTAAVKEKLRMGKRQKEERKNENHDNVRLRVGERNSLGKGKVKTSVEGRKRKIREGGKRKEVKNAKAVDDMTGRKGKEGFEEKNAGAGRVGGRGGEVRKGGRGI
jgi:hypothetical protein